MKDSNSNLIIHRYHLALESFFGYPSHNLKSAPSVSKGALWQLGKPNIIFRDGTVLRSEEDALSSRKYWPIETLPHS